MDSTKLKTFITKKIIYSMSLIISFVSTVSCAGGNNLISYQPKFDMINNNNSLYYKIENNLYSYDLQNNKKTLLYSEIDLLSDLMCDGKNIYFSNENNLYAFNLSDNSSKCICTFESEYKSRISLCNIYGNNLFLTVKVSQDDIQYSKIIILSLEDYSLKLSLTKNDILGDIVATEEKIYYTMGVADPKLYSMNYDGSENTELYSELKFVKLISCSDKELIVVIQPTKNQVNHRLYTIGLDNGSVSEIIDYEIASDSLVRYDDNIYFLSTDNRGIFCYRNGKVNTVVSDISADQICVTENGFYIYNVYEKLSYYDIETQHKYDIDI